MAHYLMLEPAEGDSPYWLEAKAQARSVLASESTPTLEGRRAVSETEVQCARCGSSLTFEDCEMCPATGWYGEFDPTCPLCKGSGRVPVCLSAPTWCEDNALPGREEVVSHTPEFYE